MMFEEMTIFLVEDNDFDAQLALSAFQTAKVTINWSAPAMAWMRWIIFLGVANMRAEMLRDRRRLRSSTSTFPRSAVWKSSRRFAQMSAPSIFRWLFLRPQTRIKRSAERLRSPRQQLRDEAG